MKPALIAFFLALFFVPGAYAIFGGAEVTSEQDFAKSIFALYTDDGFGNEVRPCTAVIISQKKLLTAAHCVDDSDRRVLLYRTLDYNHDKRKGRLSPFLIIRYPQIRIHSDYRKNSDSSQGDIALIYLSDPLPTGFQSINVASSEEIQNATDVQALGYGDGEITGDKSGVLRTVSLKRTQSEDPQLIKVDQSQGRGICTGDSGGPALISIQGTYKLAGVAAYATHKPGRATCSSTGVYLQITKYLEWISE